MSRTCVLLSVRRVKRISSTLLMNISSIAAKSPANVAQMESPNRSITTLTVAADFEAASDCRAAPIASTVPSTPLRGYASIIVRAECAAVSKDSDSRYRRFSSRMCIRRRHSVLSSARLLSDSTSFTSCTNASI